MATNQPAERTFECGYGLPANAVAVTPDGTWIVTAGSDTRVRVWNMNGGLERTLEGHNERLRAVIVTPDGARIVSAGDETKIQVWNLATGELERTIESRANAVAVTPDGARIMVGAGDIEVWTLATGELERTLESHGVSALAVSRDGARVVSVGSQEGIARIWRL